MAAKVKATQKQWEKFRGTVLGVPIVGAEAAAEPGSRALTSFRRDARKSSQQPPQGLRERDIVGHYIGTDKAPGILRAAGWTCIRLQRGNFATKDGRRITTGEPGMADWLVMRKTVYQWGRNVSHLSHAFLEFKCPGGKPSPAQIAWAEKMRRRGFDVRCIDGLGQLGDWL